MFSSNLVKEEGSWVQRFKGSLCKVFYGILYLLKSECRILNNKHRITKFSFPFCQQYYLFDIRRSSFDILQLYFFSASLEAFK